MRIVLSALLLGACGGSSSSGAATGKTQPVAISVLSHTTGTAILPPDLQIASDQTFTGAGGSATWNVDRTDLLPFTGAVIASLAVPATYGDLLTFFAQANPTPPVQTALTITDASSTNDCVLDFASGANAIGTACTVALFGGKIASPGPAPLALTATLNQGNVTVTNADIGINSGSARGVVWFQRGSIAKLTAPAAGHLGAISAPVVSGDVLVTPPPNLTSALTATFIVFFDENGDGILQSSEVVSGDIKLAADTALSSIIPAAAAQALLTALESASVNYVAVAVVRSKTGDILKTTQIAVQADLSMSGTASLSK